MKSVTDVVWSRSIKYHLELIIPQDDEGARNRAFARLIRSVEVGSDVGKMTKR